MEITSPTLTAGLLAATDDPIAADKLKREQRFAELLADQKAAEAALGEITKGGATGYWKWKIEELRKQLREQVMTEMNLTPEKLAAMSAKERVETENKISDMVEERLKLAMNEEMKRKKKVQLAHNASARAILSVQDIAAAS